MNAFGQGISWHECLNSVGKGYSAPHNNARIILKGEPASSLKICTESATYRKRSKFQKIPIDRFPRFDIIQPPNLPL